MASKRTKHRETARPPVGSRWRRRKPHAAPPPEESGTWTIIAWSRGTKLAFATMRQHPLDDIVVAEDTLRRLYEQVG